MLLLALLAACGPDATHPFPEDFLWGSATAGFQVDMGCPTRDDCLDPASDWYQWVTTPSIVEEDALYVTGEPVQNGPGMWELFEQDVATMKADGHTSFRMSLEWSRLFPDGAAEAASTVDALAAHADADAVARYHEMFAALQDAGISPFVTLNHYTLPLWVHDGVRCHEDLDACEANGWVDGDRIVPLIGLYAGFCAREFGAEVDRWGTLNEPFATTLSGYVLPGETRSAPPGLFSNGAAARDVTLHQVEGHAAMYDAVHAEDAADADGDGLAAEVGLVLNMVAIAPDDPDDPDDVEAVAHLDQLYHGIFLDALTHGDWDPNLDGVVDETRADLAGRLDFIGVNYYNRVVVNHVGIALMPEVPLADFVPTFDLSPYEEGMAEVVTRAAGYDLPIIIAENGSPELESAEEVLEQHLLHLHAAIEAGADVRGYHYWSWVDNYEWNHGLAMRFGLYELGPDKERVARPVVDLYRETIRADGLVR